MTDLDCNVYGATSAIRLKHITYVEKRAGLWLDMRANYFILTNT